MKIERFCYSCGTSLGESFGVSKITNHKTKKVIYNGEGICGVCSNKFWVAFIHKSDTTKKKKVVLEE